MKTFLLATTAILVLTPAYAGGSSRAGSGSVAISNNVNVNHNQNLNFNRNTNINRNTAVGLGVGISNVQVRISTGGGGVGAPPPMSFAPLPFNQVSGVNYFQGSPPGGASAFIIGPPYTPAQSGYGNPGAELGTKHYDSSMPPVEGKDIHSMDFKDGSNNIHVRVSPVSMSVVDENNGVFYDRFRAYGPIDFQHPDADTWTWIGPLHTNDNVRMFGHLQRTEAGWTYEETQDVGGASRTFTPRVASKEK